MTIGRQWLRLLDGASLAALRTLFRRGPRQARKVVGVTLRAAHGRPGVHEVTDWYLVRAFASPGTVVLDGADWLDGSVAPLERFLLAHLVRFFAPRRILEVGTYRGATTRLFLDNMLEDARVYTVDLPPEVRSEAPAFASDERLIRHRELGIAFRGHARASAVVQVLGDSFRDDTWNSIPQGIDFAFIDGSHSYEAVRNDSERAFGKLADAGVVVWHDYTDDETPERGVGRYLRELMRTRSDVCVCTGTSLGFRIAERVLRDGEERVRDCFPAGDYALRYPRGSIPWLGA